MDPTRTPLDVIRIANPCPVSWDSMNGDARTRFCAHCQRDVHDLTTMTQAEANDLICASAGELCVRFARTPEGKVMTLEYAPRPRGHGRARKWLSAAALTAFLAGCGQLLWHRRQPPPPRY